MLLIKLGGSVLTEKARVRTARRSAIVRLARELAVAEDDLVLVHGAGSFGHPLARRYALDGPRRGGKAAGTAVVQRDVKALNAIVVDALLAAGLRPVSLAPSALLTMEDGHVATFDLTPFLEFRDLGCTPVTFGDVVLDRRRGVSICSGDVLMFELAKVLRPARVLFVADVDGLFTADPKRQKNARLLEEVSKATLREVAFGLARGHDVTGGIEAKVRRMLEIAAHTGECFILNGNVKNRLRDAVLGRPVPGTRVVGGP